MANSYLKTPNSKYILPHLTIKEKMNVTIKTALKSDIMPFVNGLV